MTHTFKSGDRVRCIKGGITANVGRKDALGTVTSLTWGGATMYVQMDGTTGPAQCVTCDRFVPHVEAPSLAPIGTFSGPYRTAKVVKTWIIAVLDKDGLPQPTTKPKVYSSSTQAETVAKEMAKKHPGETFMVFQGTHVAAQPKVVEVELVKL